MSVKTYTKTMLLCALVALAIGGFMIHRKVHPIWSEDSKVWEYKNLVPAISGVLAIIIVPLLFCFRKTIAYGYVLNGFTVIVGTVTMAHYSIANWPSNLTIDIIILWSKFFVGKALFDLEFFGYDALKEKKGKTLRYPNLGWWVVHLVTVSIVYYLGHILWR